MLRYFTAQMAMQAAALNKINFLLHVGAAALYRCRELLDAVQISAGRTRPLGNTAARWARPQEVAGVSVSI